MGKSACVFIPDLTGTTGGSDHAQDSSAGPSERRAGKGLGCIHRAGISQRTEPYFNLFHRFSAPTYLAGIVPNVDSSAEEKLSEAGRSRLVRIPCLFVGRAANLPPIRSAPR